MPGMNQKLFKAQFLTRHDTIINHQWKCNNFSRPLFTIHYHHESIALNKYIQNQGNIHVSLCKIMATEIAFHTSITFHNVHMSANPQTSTRSLINSGFFNKIQKVANSIFIQMCFPCQHSTTQSILILVVIYW